MVLERNVLRKKELGKSLKFQFFAPEAQEVNVAGSINEWNPKAFSLTRGRDGNWSGEMWLEPGRYEYRFVIDQRWENDQRPVETAPNPFGSWNSILEVR
jgi:1,4-alpha-glucan branching enzyme